MIATTADPAHVAAQLRRRIAQHDYSRRTRQALILALDGYSRQLKIENMLAADLVGRLRRDAAHYEADAERIRRQRRLSTTTKMRAAA